MLKVPQTIDDGVKGNCMAACVASILELSIDDVPNYHGYNWWNRWIAWGRRQGINFTCYWIDEMKDVWCPVSFWIAGPDSPRLKKPDGTPIKHAVVVNKGKLVWDPHPLAYEGSVDLSTSRDCILLEYA